MREVQMHPKFLNEVKAISDPIVEGQKIYFYELGYSDYVKCYFLKEIIVDFQFTPAFVYGNLLFSESLDLLVREIEKRRNVTVNLNREIFNL